MCLKIELRYLDLKSGQTKYLYFVFHFRHALVHGVCFMSDMYHFSVLLHFCELSNIINSLIVENNLQILYKT